MRRVRTAVGVALCAPALWTAACSGGGAGAVQGSGPTVDAQDGRMPATGSIGMALTIAPGVQFQSLDWSIAGPAGPFTGTVPIDNAQSVEFVTGDIPAGGPYTISLTGTDSHGDPCEGSSTFNVTAGQVSRAYVLVTCSYATDAAVAADVNRGDSGGGTSFPGYNCPTVSSIGINPSAVAVGQQSQLSVSTTTAPGGSPGTPTFAWAAGPATLGVFDDAGVAAPVFQCVHTGSVTVSVVAGLTAFVGGVDAGNVCLGAPDSSASGTIACQNPVAVAVATGAAHTCALLASGQVYCWGLNEDGQLGDGTTTDSSTPVAVSGLTGAAAIAAGGLHTCALLTNGTVQCWGQNASGQLGNGTDTNSSTPVAVSQLTGVTAIASGELFTCALIAGGTVECWGDDDYGELGNSLDLASYSPLPLPVGVTGATAIVAGYSHACALQSGGAVSCWGDNTFAELGGGTSLASTSAPVAVLAPGGASSLSGATAIAAGIGYHTCALLSGGTVDCWGSNSGGQLGNTTTSTCDGSTPCSSAPVAVSGLTGVQAIAAGWRDSYALLAGGAVDAWGENLDGELGQGTATGSSQAPIAIKGLGGTGSLSDVTSLYAGADQACALLPGGAIECWGDDVYGELGNGASGSSGLAPVAVTW